MITMTDPTIGSLCSGYGGLDLAVERFFRARTAWFSEYESAPSKVLARHWPDVPNLGDMTKIDWASAPRVSIVCGGTPCQDLSGAGRRAGMTEGTRSNLWVQMRECIAAVRPQLVIWENVRGAFSAYAASDVEHEPGLLGEHGPDRPALRALGRVLGDLSDLGYDTEWVGVRASDAGAPHGRFRVFVLAYARRLHGGAWWAAGPGETASGRASADDCGRGAFSADAGGARLGEHAVEPSEEEAWPSGGDESEDRRGVRPDQDWGPYRPAVRRWEHVLGRVAPEPTEPGARRGSARRLSARFEEWMMGLPDGWVTSPDIGLSWNEQVKALGNGVVPQQALLALSIMWPRVVVSLGIEAAA